jgi:hypothetical protein
MLEGISESKPSSPKTLETRSESESKRRMGAVMVFMMKKLVLGKIMRKGDKLL